jgi:hypothetical protein
MPTTTPPKIYQPTEEQLTLLKSSIDHFIGMTVGDVVTLEIRSQMSWSLVDFVANSTLKFGYGQLEHGGDIRDRNLDAEIKNELTDMFWYQSVKTWAKKTL